MQYLGSLKAAEKHISAKIFEENLHTSVKILQICIDLQDSVQRSLQNAAELHRFAKIKNLGTTYILEKLRSLKIWLSTSERTTRQEKTEELLFLIY